MRGKIVRTIYGIRKKEIDEYLKETELINSSHQLIQEIIYDKFNNLKDNVALINCIYEFVRDKIHHSWDIQSKRITIKASDVLQYRV